MPGSRQAIAAGLSHVGRQVKALEHAVFDNPGLAFDLSRTLVESVCRTILTERAVMFDDQSTLPGLFKLTTQHLPMLPTEESDEVEVRRSLNQTVSGLHTALQGVCELRNACGFASHGSADKRPELEAVQAILAAQTADAIVGFLYGLHRGSGAPSGRLTQGRSTTVDAVLEHTFDPAVIAGQPYAVGEALFKVDNEAYFAIAANVQESRNIRNDLSAVYPNIVRGDIEQLTFVHFNDVVYLKVMNDDGQVTLTDTAFISGDHGEQFFGLSRSAESNADLLLTEFDPFSIINCFDLFTEEGATQVADAHASGTMGALFPTNQGGAS